MRIMRKESKDTHVKSTRNKWCLCSSDCDPAERGVWAPRVGFQHGRLQKHHPQVVPRTRYLRQRQGAQEYVATPERTRTVSTHKTCLYVQNMLICEKKKKYIYIYI